ncbi:hypothetical protein HaLaN_09714 [Haematococcus lacustris]|uniref:Uncharacterized protein n=1 Tax=Haematococcus lacustris TaxID=44745 RepID=A0A699Z3X9_HAELA|nr:hypothetical protein HaLaN_09714 [Haematococcus lacustris]
MLSGRPSEGGSGHQLSSSSSNSSGSSSSSGSGSSGSSGSSSGSSGSSGSSSRNSSIMFESSTWAGSSLGQAEQQVFWQLVLALWQVHAEGLMHRDGWLAP